MKKRAEMTTQQIVILIVLIASFAVILFFLSKLYLGSESQKELCHNSVVMRANMPIGGDSVPLNCKREYVCITEDGSCESLTNPIKYKVKTEEEVYEILANELADCWWMFGEGKIDYVGKDTFPGLYCSLCSQIAFDDSVQKIFNANEFDKRNLYEYMANNEISNEETYSKYLYGTNDLSEISGGLDFGKVFLDKQYYAMMGIVSEIGAFQCGVWGAVVNPILSIYCFVDRDGFTEKVMKTGNFFMGRIMEGVDDRGFLIPSLVEANSEQYNELSCKSITTLS
jgi:hypothetical protein